MNAGFENGRLVPSDADQNGSAAVDEFYRRAALMEEEDVVESAVRAAIRETGIKYIDYQKDVFRAILGFKGDCRFGVYCICAAHGLWTLIPMKDQKRIADEYGFTKANANKRINIFRKMLGLPITAGQRGEEGRDNMRQARREQLQ